MFGLKSICLVKRKCACANSCKSNELVFRALCRTHSSKKLLRYWGEWTVGLSSWSFTASRANCHVHLPRQNFLRFRIKTITYRPMHLCLPITEFPWRGNQGLYRRAGRELYVNELINREDFLMVLRPVTCLAIKSIKYLWNEGGKALCLRNTKFLLLALNTGAWIFIAVRILDRASRDNWA